MDIEIQKLKLIQRILLMQDGQLLFRVEKLLKKEIPADTDIDLKQRGPGNGKKRQYGFAKGMTKYIAPDFDKTPPGFEDYMPKS